MKAIHNKHPLAVRNDFVVSDQDKELNESNSQQRLSLGISGDVVSDQDKELNESNSQLALFDITTFDRCVRPR